jgi:uncharacterized protein (DUF302 family)
VDIKYEVKTEKSFEEAVGALKKSLEENKFGVLWELDFKDKLEEKGLEFNAHFKIFEVCNPVQAKNVLEKHIEVGYFLPCKLVIYEKAEGTYIGMMKPAELIGLLGYDDLVSLAKEVEAILVKAIDGAV